MLESQTRGANNKTPCRALGRAGRLSITLVWKSKLDFQSAVSVFCDDFFLDHNDFVTGIIRMQFVKFFDFESFSVRNYHHVVTTTGFVTVAAARDLNILMKHYVITVTRNPRVQVAVVTFDNKNV